MYIQQCLIEKTVVKIATEGIEIYTQKVLHASYLLHHLVFILPRFCVAFRIHMQLSLSFLSYYSCFFLCILLTVSCIGSQWAYIYCTTSFQEWIQIINTLSIIVLIFVYTMLQSCSKSKGEVASWLINPPLLLPSPPMQQQHHWFKWEIHYH